MRVQEYIARSGRYHCTQTKYNDLRIALGGLKSLIRTVIYTLADDCTVVTDGNTHFTIMKGSQALRRYTIVDKKKGEPIPFGHMLKKQQ